MFYPSLPPFPPPSLPSPLPSLPPPPLDLDGLFLSNGPGDPEMLAATVSHIRAYISHPTARPVFGICMGHALLSQAIGAKIFKMK